MKTEVVQQWINPRYKLGDGKVWTIVLILRWEAGRKSDCAIHVCQTQTRFPRHRIHLLLNVHLLRYLDQAPYLQAPSNLMDSSARSQAVLNTTQWKSRRHQGFRLLGKIAVEGRMECQGGSHQTALLVPTQGLMLAWYVDCAVYCNTLRFELHVSAILLM